MYCDVCKKNPANIHYMKIINGHKEERHLCEDCAGQLQEPMSPLPTISLMPDFSMADFIGGFFNQGNQAQAFVQKNMQSNDACPVCGMMAGEFRKLGQVGCSNCYQYFGDYMPSLIQRIHGNTRHIGKVPMRGQEHLATLHKASDLRNQLQQAIVAENFELAATLRDELKALEDKDTKGGERDV